MTKKYDDGTCAKWYYNLSNNITDGEDEYTIHRKEPVEYLDGTILHGTNDLLDRLNDYEKENEELQQQVTHLTMYKNLFREFQKQLDGVKKKSDLDHKDFEDLLELTNGHVFDDKLGWIWLPVNDR